MFGRKSRNKLSDPTADTPIPALESRGEVDASTSDTSTSKGNNADAVRGSASAEGQSHEVKEKSGPSLSYGAIDHRGLDPWDKKSRGSSDAKDSNDLADLQAMDDLDDIPTVSGSRPVKPARSASSATSAEPDGRAGHDDPRDDHASDRRAAEFERDTAHDVPHDVASREAESEAPSDENFAANELTVVEQRPQGRRDIYSLTGRAAPQVITPREQPQEPENHDPLFDQPEDIPGARSTSDEDAVFANAPVSDLDMATMDEEEPSSTSRTSASADGRASSESAPRYETHDTYVDRPDEQINETRVDMPTSGAYDRDHVDRVHYADDRQNDRAAAGMMASEGAAGEYRDGAVPLGEDDRPIDNTGDVDVDDEIYEDEDPRRGTTDFGLFLIRLALGAMLLFYGVRTLFELGGSSGVDGLHNDFYFMKGNELLAWAVPIIETAAGAFLVLGVLAPLGACMAVAVSSLMAMYSIDLQPGAFSPFNLTPHVQVWLLLTALAIGVAFSGPGKWGVDATRGWARRPLGSGWFSTIIGLLAGAAVWVVVAQSNPFN